MSEQYTRDRSSGRVHRRTADGRTFEACNLDAAGAFDVIPDLRGIELRQMCARCFPATHRFDRIEAAAAAERDEEPE